MSSQFAALPSDVAWVISDLHLGGKPGFQMFRAGQQFAFLMEKIIEEQKQRQAEAKAAKKTPPQTVLVINGDFIDFLAEQPQHGFSQHLAVAMLRRILEDPAFRPVTDGLKQYLKEDGTRLVVVLGNHDLELTVPECAAEFIRILSEEVPERANRISLSFDGWGYRFNVAGRTALCLHGNETDSWNFTKWDELSRIRQELEFDGESSFAGSWMPSAGTQMVLGVVNPLKKDYPFVDLMYPLFPLLTTVLGLLNPANIQYVASVADAASQAAHNDAIRSDNQRRMLAATSGRPSRRLSADEIIRRAEQAMMSGKSGDVLSGSQFDGTSLLLFDDWMSSIRAAADSLKARAIDLGTTAANQLDAAKRAIHRETMRMALKPIVESIPDHFGDLSREDTVMEETIKRNYSIVLAGHTHHRRLCQRITGSGWYVNTGTWADRMTLLKEHVSSSGRFLPIYNAMIGESGQTPAEARKRLTDVPGLITSECPVACIRSKENGAGVDLELACIVKGSSEKLEYKVDRTVPL